MDGADWVLVWGDGGGLLGGNLSSCGGWRVLRIRSMCAQKHLRCSHAGTRYIRRERDVVYVLLGLDDLCIVGDFLSVLVSFEELLSSASL